MKCLLLTAALLPVLALSQQACPSYEDTLARVDQTTTLRCDSGMMHWVRAKERCGPFEAYPQCSQQNQCPVTVGEENGRYFYYCCSENEENETITSSAMRCFHIQVCAVIQHDSILTPPFLAYGQQASLYLPVFSEPLPTVISPLATLQLPTEVKSLEVQQGYTFQSSSSPVRVWLFTFTIPSEPSPETSRLTFQVNFTTPREACSVEKFTRVLTVTNNTGIMIAAESPTAVRTDSTASQGVSPSTTTAQDCSVCVAGVVVVGVGLGISLLVCALLAMCLVRQYYIATRSEKNKAMIASDVVSTVDSGTTTSTTSNSSSHTAQKKRPAILFKFRRSYNVLQTSSATPTPLTPGTRTLQGSTPILQSTQVATIPEGVETDQDATTTDGGTVSISTQNGIGTQMVTASAPDTVQNGIRVQTPPISVPDFAQNGIRTQTDDTAGNRISVADSSENAAQLLDACRDSRDRLV